MKKCMLLLKSLRPVNLLMGVAILWSVRRGVFGTEAPQTTEDTIYFALYSVSVMFCMAWGYLINDCLDVKADRVNKPGRNIFDGSLRRSGKILMALSFAGGVALPVILFFSAEVFPGGTVFLNITALFLLWLYSRRLKSTVLLGNVLISFLALLLMAAPLFFIRDREALSSDSLFRWGIFAAFSFWVTFIRELVKDAEDVHGDKQAGVRTLATRSGAASALKAAGPQSLGMSVMLVFLFTFELTRQAHSFRAISYLLLAGMGFISGTAILAASSKKQIARASLILKLWMAGGIVSMWI